MFDSKTRSSEIKKIIKRKNNRGQKALILSAAAATLVASGETGDGSGPNFVTGDLNIPVNENQSVVGTATAAGDHDYTYSISGADAALFNIDPTTSELTFKADPDFETPADVGGDNVYNVIVTATDTDDQFGSVPAVITVLNVNEAPNYADAATLAVNAAENQTTVATVAATDVDGDTLSYALSGADAALFDISAAGAISFKAAPDFEVKGDAGADGIYKVTVTASDAGGLNTTRDVEITVTDGNDAPSFADSSTLAVSAAENQTSVTTVTATDLVGDILTYTLSGVDADMFEISATGAITFKTAPDFETKADTGNDGVYDITVTATDTGGLSASRDVAITVTDANDAPEFASTATLTLNANENQLAVGSVVASDIDGDEITYTLSGTDEALFDISSAGVVTFKATPNFEDADDADTDGVYEFDVVATDANNAAISRHVSVTVEDVDDTAPRIAAGNQFFKSGSEFLVNTKFTAAQTEPAITGLVGGGYVIVWNSNDSNIVTGGDGDGYAVKMQVFNADGTKLGDEKIVNSLKNGDQLNAEVVALQNGDFIVTWLTDNTNEADPDAVKMQRFTAAGEKIGGEKILNEVSAESQGAPNLLELDNGNIVYTWSSHDATFGEIILKAKILDEAGNVVKAEFNLSPIDTVGNGPQLAKLSNGDFVVTFTAKDSSQDGIKFSIFKADGTALVSDQIANIVETSFQTSPDVVALSDGRFVIVWTNYNTGSGDGDSGAIMMRIYASDGTAETTEEVLNNLATGGQAGPSVSALPAGGYVVTWQSADASQDGSGNAIKARQFYDNGDPMGGEYLVNSEADDSQLSTEVATTVNDDFVITWHTYNAAQDGNSFAVKAQTFKLAPLQKFEKGVEVGFSIGVEAHPEQVGGTIGDIVISNIPVGMTFSAGTSSAGGTVWTLSEADLLGLKITPGGSVEGEVELNISVESLDSGGDGISTATSVKLSVGTSLIGTTSGGDNLSLTAGVDHVDGLTGTADRVDFALNEADYLFEVVGADLKITNKNDATDYDLLHSIEAIGFADSGGALLNASGLDSTVTLELNGVDFDDWMANVYDYG